MAEIIRLDDHRPHCTVSLSGAVIVLPVSLIESIAEGKSCVSECDEPGRTAQALAVMAAAYLECLDGAD